MDYKNAGVDIEAGYKSVELMKDAVKSTFRPEVLGGIGGFSELIGLDDKNVDFSSLLIKVTGKRNKQRLIPFGEELKNAMIEYVNVRNEIVQARTDAFFVRESGERLSRSIVENLVKRNLSKVVTLKKRSPHVLRHTFATTMLNHDAELGAIKELLGHESLATTEVYTHTTFEELKKVYNQAHPRA